MTIRISLGNPNVIEQVRLGDFPDTDGRIPMRTVFNGRSFERILDVKHLITLLDVRNSSTCVGNSQLMVLDIESNKVHFNNKNHLKPPVLYSTSVPLIDSLFTLTDVTNVGKENLTTVYTNCSKVKIFSLIKGPTISFMENVRRL